MDIKPILSSLRRSPTGALLVALQIALALAIAVNSMYIIVQRMELLNRDHGVDVEHTFVVSWVPIAGKFAGEPAMREDLQVLGNLPGVVAATTVNAVPLSGGGSSSSFYTQPGEKGQRADVNYFAVTEQGIEAFGLQLVEGRNFDATTVRKLPRNGSEFVPEVILTRAAAKELFKDQPALGRTIYDSLGQPATVVGLVEGMIGSWPSWEKAGNVALLPVIADEQQARYFVRAAPGQRDAAMNAAEEALGRIDNGRVILRVRALDYIAASTYADDRAMTVYLAVVIVLLLGVAALGIFGLASFNVGTRTKQIGTRRAVGARRLDVVRHFLVENWLVTTAGVVLGCVLALLLGLWLSETFELPRLKLYYLVAGALLLWGVSLASALVPARRAALVSPAVATRTV